MVCFLLFVVLEVRFMKEVGVVLWEYIENGVVFCEFILDGFLYLGDMGFGGCLNVFVGFELKLLFVLVLDYRNLLN